MSTSGPSHLFRALWPITDMTTPLGDLIDTATRDLPMVAARAHAEVQAGGRWLVAASAKVPGSGRVTENVLLYEAPAAPIMRSESCPRCHVEVVALVDDTGVCIACDADRDLFLVHEDVA